MCFLFWEGTEPLRPFGAPPLSGEALGVGAASLRSCGIMIFFINDLILQRVSLSSTTCLAAGGPPPSAEEGFWLRTQPLRPFGAPPLSGEAFGVGDSMRLSVRVTFIAYASPKRQGVPAAVYGQPPECHGAEPKECPVVSPWEGSDPDEGWEQP